jgi:hypothetical protein
MLRNPASGSKSWRIPTEAIIPAAIRVTASPMLKHKTSATPSQIRLT